MTDPVRFEVRGAIARIELANPPVNAFSLALARSLAAVLPRIEHERASVVVLAAQGTRAFCAGMDLRERAAVDGAGHARRAGEVRAVLDALRAVPVPVVCAVGAPAVGVGVALMLCCDLRWAADRASVSLPEIDRGTTADGGLGLRRAGVPAGAVRELLFTGRTLSAADALAVRLVDRVVPAGDLGPAVDELAAEIAAKPRPALVRMKQAIRTAEDEPDPARAAARIAALSDEHADTADAREGVAAFLAGRAARYGAPR